SLPPCLKTRKGFRRLKFPRPSALLPMRVNLIHPRIASRIVAERVAPALGYRNLKYLFIGPLQKAKPEKLRLSWMLLGIRGCVFHKARAALLKNRDHRVGNESLGLDDQTEPIGNCSPLDEFGDGLRKTFRRNESAFVLCKLLRSSPQVEFSLPRIGRTVHQDSQELGRRRVAGSGLGQSYNSRMEALVIHSGLKIRYNIGLGSSAIPRTFCPLHYPTSPVNEAYMPLADTLQPITIGSADA